MDQQGKDTRQKWQQHWRWWQIAIAYALGNPSNCDKWLWLFPMERKRNKENQSLFNQLWKDEEGTIYKFWQHHSCKEVYIIVFKEWFIFIINQHLDDQILPHWKGVGRWCITNTSRYDWYSQEAQLIQKLAVQWFKSKYIKLMHSTADLAACFGSGLIVEQVPIFYAAEW